MPDRSFLNWPFFEDRHRAHAERLEAWCVENLPVDHTDVDAACRRLVAMLGEAGFLLPTAVDPRDPAPLDVRTPCRASARARSACSEPRSSSAGWNARA
jgi:acyl-CoA dehydrogenase